MKQELIYIIDKIEHIKCKTHSKIAAIDIIDDNIQISCCCEEHKGFLERQIEYEIYKLLGNEDEEAAETLPPLKYAV